MSQNMARWSWPWVVRRWTCHKTWRDGVGHGVSGDGLVKKLARWRQHFFDGEMDFSFFGEMELAMGCQEMDLRKFRRDGVGHGVSGDGVARWTREMELAMHVQEMESGDGVARWSWPWSCDSCRKMVPCSRKRAREAFSNAVTLSFLICPTNDAPKAGRKSSEVF